MDEPQTHEDLKVDMQLCLALQVASSLVTKLYRPLLAPLDLSHPQYLVLLALWERRERATMGDLRRTLALDTGSLTPLVKKMEARGLLKRVRDPADERKVFVDLTDAGWALQDAVGQVRRQVVDQLPLNGDEIADLRTFLQTMNRQLAGQAAPIR